MPNPKHPLYYVELRGLGGVLNTLPAWSAQDMRDNVRSLVPTLEPGDTITITENTED